MAIYIKIIGYIFIILSIIHLGFPKYFNWQNELSSLSLMNRQMMKTHTFFIALTVFLMGVLCITATYELTETLFGKKIMLGLGVFWSTRLFFQFFVYSKKLWRGKLFETIIHIVFSMFWLFSSAVFFISFYND
ncbi:hypothetical protein PK35_14015 [Tamlana nanhaiensis]|uniref:Uncharacterized protein n=1 Tax=Neotamlana nanhaiensis TaxID=1382798 RepID=A0A0D7VXK8_9FLAO|nr:hypothetical protein PK35_14015 [Tamlana nanhaiensis]